MGASDPITREEKILVLFDGVCNLCNSSVQFIIKRDTKGKFTFTSLQSRKGQEYLKRFGLNTNAFYSLIVIEGNKVYDKSDAALKIVRYLDGLWPVLVVFSVIPRPIRNFFYNLVSKNRYKLFGKQDQCMIPTPELKARFISD